MTFDPLPPSKGKRDSGTFRTATPLSLRYG